MSRGKSFFLSDTLKYFKACSQTILRCRRWEKFETWQKYGLKIKEEGIMLAGSETIWELA